MYTFYESPTTLAEALRLKAHYGDTARILAGGTDLLIELERGARKLADGRAPGVIDLTRVPGLAEIWEADGWIHLGPLVTHNQCVVHPLIVAQALPLARACWEVGAPQIRNRGTVAGNLITASPANDTIVPLLALDATVTLQSAARGDRTLPLRQFMQGFRKVDLQPDEILVRISFPALSAAHAGSFIKLGLRHAQAISVLSAAVILQRAEAHVDAPVVAARITLGAVAATVIRAETAEAYLLGRALSAETMAEAARLAMHDASPIDDIRSSADYRRAMVETLVLRALQQIRNEQTRAGWSEQPILLWGDTDGKWPVVQRDRERGRTGDRENSSVVHRPPAIINGQPVELEPGMTLLNSLRAAGFVGVKEGCAEGECGACTVFLDGMAVVACLVPAERAAGSQVITVEGLRVDEQLHPVQAALVQSGGVQCGYCTPGFVMSAAKLLEESPHPTRAQAQQAFMGNLCRCTGYRKIIDAVVAADKA